MQTAELELLSLLRAEIQELKTHRMPTVLTYKAAAFELSVSLTVLKSMVRSGEIQTCARQGRKGIPASEILRIAQPKIAAAPRRAGGRKAQPKYDAKAEAEKIRASIKADRKRR
jgi:hypothetical protein